LSHHKILVFIEFLKIYIIELKVSLCRLKELLGFELVLSVVSGKGFSIPYQSLCRGLNSGLVLCNGKVFNILERSSGMIYDPKLPSRWDKDLAYLFGLLLGDGCLPITKSVRPNGKYQTRNMICFISGEIEFVNEVYIPIFKKVFGLIPRTTLAIKSNGNHAYNCRIESKRIYKFLNEMGYTIGRKAKIATVPKMPKKYHVYLLAGLLDTDGGKKGNGFGLSTASPHFAAFCIDMFESLNLPYHSCPWTYKNHVYHQIYVGRKNMWKVLKAIPIRNVNKIRFIESYMPQ
jgi:hypothetical protein